MNALGKKLAFYRGVTVVLFVLLGLLAWKLLRIAAQVGDFGEAGQTWVVDLDERATIIEDVHGDEADYSETYLSTEAGSVHLHAMGHEQLTPLHLHPASDEVTVITKGLAHVSHAWGTSSREADYPAGSVIASPRWCAHEWKNPSKTQMLFNLVFTSPRFSGNFYVHPDDPRLAQGLEPSMPVPGGTETPTHLSALGGRLLSLRIQNHWAFPSTSRAPVMIWVHAGEGLIGGHPVKPHSLVHLEGGSVEAIAKAPLELLLFDVTGRAFQR